jgi:toxin-antitoxin system PIN domain toxin
MRALLDVNVLIALFDPDHVFHSTAHQWWSANQNGWASCPITENGLVRIVCQPRYSEKVVFTPSDVISNLRTFAQQSDHVFWPDDVSLRESGSFLIDRIHGSRQITDLYLLALATKHNGRLVTFDGNIPISPIAGAGSSNIYVIT